MRKLMIVILTLLAFAGSIYAQGWACYGNGAVWIHEVGKSPIKVSSNGQHACFSKDGKVVFFNRGGDVYGVKNDGTGEKKLGTSQTGKGATYCAYRPEPQSVMVRTGSDYYKIDYATATKTLVAKTNNGGLYGELAISDDGKRMAARLGGDLFKADISGTSATWSKYAGNCSASISPNGQKMTENGGDHKTMKIYNWGGGSSTMKNTAGGTWDNQRFSVNSNDWVAVVFDNRVGANQGRSVGAHQISTNKTVKVGNTSGGDTQYPDFWFGDLPDQGTTPTSKMDRNSLLSSGPNFTWIYNAITEGIEFSATGLDNTIQSEMSIYDIHGKAVSSMDLNNLDGTFSWYGLDNNGQAVSKGVYLSVLKNGNNSMTKRFYLD